jgi:phosphomevalonate kinase
MNYEGMSIQELEAQNRKLSEERDKVKAEQRILGAVMDKKKMSIAVQKKLETMSDAEKAAMAQMIESQGIGSSAAVGGLKSVKKTP